MTEKPNCKKIQYKTMKFLGAVLISIVFTIIYTKTPYVIIAGLTILLFFVAFDVVEMKRKND